MEYRSNFFVTYCLVYILFICGCRFTSNKIKSEGTDSFRDPLTSKGLNRVGQNIPRLYNDSIYDQISIGTPIRKIKLVYSGFNVKYNSEFGGYQFFDQKHNIDMFLTVIKDTIQEVSILNNVLYLVGDTDLHVGTSVSKIKSKFGKLPIRYNNLDDVEFFTINYVGGLVLQLNVISNKEGPLGSYSSDLKDSTLMYDTSGYIGTISIYKRGSIVDPNYGKNL